MLSVNLRYVKIENMKSLPFGVIILFLATLILSCKDDEINKIEQAKSLIVGQWNSYEIGSQQTGFIPEKETLITIVYASGVAFYADGSFGARFYDTLGWHEGVPPYGVYEFKNDKTVDLIFHPSTADELRLELQIKKLDDDHLWVQHKYFVNEQNPSPTEHHLERAN